MKADTYRGKVCVVTGAASGIGRAVAIALAEAGAKLAMSDVNIEGLGETKSLLSSNAAIVKMDSLNVADKDAISAYAEQIGAALGPADFLFNIAGITRVGEFQHTPLESMELIMDVNYWGMVRMTKAFLDQIMSTKGTVINVSSLFGLISYKGQSHYCASKFAIRGFTETLELEMAEHGVGVCLVHPGGIATNIARNAEVDHMPNTGKTRDEMADEFDTLAITTAEKAADNILTGAEKRNKRIIVGADAKIASFLQRMMPKSYHKALNLYAKDKVLN